MLVWIAAAWAMDGDGDGWDAAQDCDDADPAVNPGAAEVCGGADEDCDGLVDDEDPGVTGAPTWYYDRDNDQYGKTTAAVTRCVPPNPYDFVLVGGDCDDRRRTVHPGAAEVCDDQNRDEDCDGTADDADASVTRKISWYADADADGYGSGPRVAFRCEAPPGTANNTIDCNDGDPSVFVSDHWYPDADADGFVDRAQDTVSCDPPGPEWTRDETASDCDDAEDSTWPDAPETCEDAVDSDCDGYDGACPWWDASLTGESASGAFGRSTSVGDLDGDGVHDLLVTSESTLRTFEGPFSGDRLASTADGYWTMAVSGTVEATLGDLDGDGRSELLVGDPAMQVPGRGPAGGAYVIPAGAPDGAGIDAAVVTFLGVDPFAENGAFVAAGDVEGDGDDDVWIASPYRNDAGSQSGLVFLQTFPPPSATIDLGQPTSGVIYGDQPGQFLGYTGLLADDLDGDGDEDLVFASSRNGPAVASLFLVRDAPVGLVAASASGAVLTVPSAGFPVIGAFSIGDLNGDGRPDVAASAAGDLFVVPGDATSGTLASRAFARLTPGTDVPEASAIGDFDGDGQDDLAVAARTADVGAAGSGVVYLVRGPVVGQLDLAAAADRVLSGTEAGDACGFDLTATDLDGDGADDLVVSCAQFDATPGPGRVLLVHAPLL